MDLIQKWERLGKKIAINKKLWGMIIARCNKLLNENESLHIINNELSQQILDLEKKLADEHTIQKAYAEKVSSLKVDLKAYQQLFDSKKLFANTEQLLAESTLKRLLDERA